MMRQLLRYLVCFVLVWLNSLCFGQVIRARIVNAKNGQPLQKQQVSVSLLYDEGGRSAASNGRVLHVETGASGQAEFTLPQPPPPHLSVQVTLTSEYWRCGCMALATTQDVIQKGITVVEPSNEAKKSGQPLQAEPGEILFYARPLTFLERLLYPLVKQ